jgi:hypothetical protein
MKTRPSLSAGVVPFGSGLVAEGKWRPRPGAVHICTPRVVEFTPPFNGPVPDVPARSRNGVGRFKRGDRPRRASRTMWQSGPGSLAALLQGHSATSVCDVASPAKLIRRSGSEQRRTWRLRRAGARLLMASAPRSGKRLARVAEGRERKAVVIAQLLPARYRVALAVQHLGDRILRRHVGRPVGADVDGAIGLRALAVLDDSATRRCGRAAQPASTKWPTSV